MREEKIPKNFDVIIMNPPFTRRERIPAKKEELEKLVPVVKGKTGYWAYFVVAANKLLKNGVLAIVIPEEFFVGKSAQSVRKYLFEGNEYSVRYILRSAAEVAFSESAHYRGYAGVTKGQAGRTSRFLCLKKKLDEIRDKTDKLAYKILKFSSDVAEKKLSTMIWFHSKF